MKCLRLVIFYFLNKLIDYLNKLTNDSKSIYLTEINKL